MFYFHYKTTHQNTEICTKDLSCYECGYDSGPGPYPIKAHQHPTPYPRPSSIPRLSFRFRRFHFPPLSRILEILPESFIRFYNISESNTCHSRKTLQNLKLCFWFLILQKSLSKIILGFQSNGQRRTRLGWFAQMEHISLRWNSPHSQFKVQMLYFLFFSINSC